MGINCLTKKIAGLFILIFPVFISAQTRVIDKLKNQISAETNDRQKLNDYLLLCEQYNSLHPDTLLTFYLAAEKLAQQSRQSFIAIDANFYKAVYFFKKAQFDSARQIIDSCVRLLNEAGQKKLTNKFLLVKSGVLIKNNKQKESIENSLHVLQSGTAINDTLSQLRAMVNVGWAYMELGQNREALRWFWDAVHFDDSTQLRYTQAPLYSDMASVYNELKENDSAEMFVKRAIEISQRDEDLTRLANAYNIYGDVCIAKNNNEKAENLLKEGLRIRELIGDPFYIVSDIYQLGVFYAHVNLAQKGIALVNEGIEMAKKYNLNSKLPILYNALAQNYQAAGDYKMYSEVLTKIISLKDSMYTKNSADALSDIQTKYEVQKGQNIIMQQKLDISKKNDLIFGALILLVITVSVFYVISAIRKKNAKLRIQEVMIDQKKKTMEAVMQAEENERKRIAADLHDSVAQKMVVAKLNLEAFESSLTKLDREQQHVFDNIISLVDDSCTEVRNLSHSMMPQAFFKSGLTDAVYNFIDKVQNNNFHVVFNAEGDLGELDKNTELMLYRIIQECLQNIIKHAEATQVDISIITDGKEIDVTIEDNGIGFDTASLHTAEGMGMKNIRSRVDYLNGELDINSKPGKGTVIAFHIPGSISKLQ